LLRWSGGDHRDPRQDVRDLVQETLVSLFEHDGRELRRWDPERGRSLTSFVRLVARRRVARILSGRRGNPWHELPLDPTDVDDEDTRALTEQVEQRGELDALLCALHAQMSDRDVELFDLLFVHDGDPGDVAEQMGMTRGAVNAWTYRMRKLAKGLATQTLEPRVSWQGRAPARDQVKGV